MSVQMLPSTELSRGELAALFTSAYRDYYVPFAVDEVALAFMVEVFDLDLKESVVALDGHRLVGLANLGRRGRRTWLGGVGVVPERRREGIGELLTRELLERARVLGAEDMVLEVIVDNRPAIELYAKLGFVHTREVEILSLAAAANGDADAEDVPRWCGRGGAPGRRRGGVAAPVRDGQALSTRRAPARTRSRASRRLGRGRTPRSARPNRANRQGGRSC
ncbi:MAG: N-acetyltransferase family protein [Gaiellaceae bacterium]